MQLGLCAKAGPLAHPGVLIVAAITPPVPKHIQHTYCVAKCLSVTGITYLRGTTSRTNEVVSAASSQTTTDADDDIAEAPEGRLLTRMHRIRERNRELVKRKRDAVLRETGRLACEVCDFDFNARYGEHGRGFIEVHHLLPLYALAPGSRTRMHDLAVLCANCHRMVHAKSKWLTLLQLKELLAE